MIEGKTIVLRTVKEGDLAEICERLNRYSEKGEFIGYRLRSFEQLYKDYQKDGLWGDETGGLAITTKEGRLVGWIWFFKTAHYVRGLEIGCGIFQKADRAQGYATEAVRIFSAYLFDEKPIQRLQICLDCDNQASRRVAEKCGFTYEGRQRHAVYRRGRPTDMDQFSLVRTECPPLADVVASLQE